MGSKVSRRTRDDHLFGPGPKRILALDGGGIRGILTLQMLRKLESIVRERTGDPDAVLADYFDLMGGTSTGSIIAAALAIGRTVDYVDDVYRELGNQIFDGSFLRRGVVRAKFPAAPLRESLEREFGEIKLGDSDIGTGLAIVAKRLDTGSPWVVHNNPRGPFFDSDDAGSTPNKDFLLREIVRASTAAPTFFDPERIRVADGVDGAFVDGGVSPHNNPSLQLLWLATLEGHGLRWPTGPENLLIVSLGTGSKEPRLEADAVMKMTAAGLGVRGLASLMDDASALNEQVLQWLSASPTARSIDHEVGDLVGDVLGGKPHLSYLRYDVDLDAAWLAENLGVTLAADAQASITEMDRPDNMAALIEVGQAAAERLVDPGHLPKPFDIA